MNLQDCSRCTLLLSWVLLPSALAQSALEGPRWIVESDDYDSRLGSSVAGAGDVDGDGFDDVIIGAPYADAGQENEGRAFLYSGSAVGLSTIPAWSAESDEADAHFGCSVSAAGDVNGDGFDDVIVGSNGHDGAQLNAGRAVVYLGSASGLSTTPAWRVEGDQDGSSLGTSVAAAGDVDGDGFDDVIVGSNGYDAGYYDAGRALVYLGSASGLSATPAWSVEGDQPGTNLGASVATAGDVNGDGFADVILGADLYDVSMVDQGRAYVYLGSSTGLASIPAWTAQGEEYFAGFGVSVATAGDVNADGFDDVIVGAPSNHEKVYLYLGSASGPSGTANWTVEGSVETTLLGKSVGSAGDVNADGFSDVFIGAPLYSSAAHWDGRAFVYTGSVNGLPAEPSWIGEGHASQALGLQYGASIASAGDVNGDGCDDLVVGARSYDVLGRAFLYQGAACNDLGSRYCSAETNSTGLPADIFASGSASASTGDLTLFAANVPIRFGLFFHGSNQTQIVFGNGYLCTTANIARGVVIQPPEFLASYSYNGSDAKHSLAGHVGSTRHFQYWFRDMFDAHFDTSNAISILIQP